MGKVTSKLQVTVPKAIAERFRIRPGDDIEWEAAGSSIRVMPSAARRPARRPEERLRAFDEATARQRRRQAGRSRPVAARTRGWRREDLYARDRPR